MGPAIAGSAMDYPELIASLIFVATASDPKLSGPCWYNRLAVPLRCFVLGASLEGANTESMPLRPHLDAIVPRYRDFIMPVLIVQGIRVT